MAKTTRLDRQPQRTSIRRDLMLVALLPLGFATSLDVPAAPPSDPTAVLTISSRAQANEAPSQQTVPTRPLEVRRGTAATRGVGTPESTELTAESRAGARIGDILASFAAEGLDPVLIGAGDIGDCGTGASFATAGVIERVRGVVFTAGDEAYPEGSAEDFDDCYAPSWGRFLDRTLPAIGNHEYVTPGAAGYLGYFDTAAASPGRTWYSLDVGAWHVVILDSDCDIVGCARGSDQLAWLKSDLAAHPTRCTLAIWHHPRFSSGGHGNDPSVALFWRALMAAGAELVINGHDHDYERFAPQTPGHRLDRTRGIREIIVGTGGAALRHFHRVRANSRIRLRAHGVLRLTLHPGGYRYRFLRADGSIADRGGRRCH